MAREPLSVVGPLFAAATPPKPIVAPEFPPGANPNARHADAALADTAHVAAAPAPRAPRAAPRTRSTRATTPSTEATTIGARVYASLPSAHEAQVRAIAQQRGWSLLGVVAAALNEYPPDAYARQLATHQPNPAPGSKTKLRHGDTYLAITVNNAEQREWLGTTLEPYRPESIAHVLGCALSHYVSLTDQ